jgi:cystathionine gamma-lyase
MTLFMLIMTFSNANAISIFLEGHPAVTKVVYPGLKSHPQHEIAKAQQHGFGAMITFYCVGGRAQSAIVLEKVGPFFCREVIQYLVYSKSVVYSLQLRVFTLAESLGAVESLAECPSLMTHASVPDEQRALLGIDDTLIRLSVGIESCSDLIADLDFALNTALFSMTKK